MPKNDIFSENTWDLGIFSQAHVCLLETETLVVFSGKNVIMVLNEIAVLQGVGIEWNMIGENGPPHMRCYYW